MESNISNFGAIVKIRLSNPHPRPFALGNGVTALPGTVEVDALTCIGAARTTILPELIRFPLGLRRGGAGPQPDAGVIAPPEVRTYTVDLEVAGVRLAGLEVFAGGVDFEEARSVFEGAGGDPHAFHVILGRDVLSRANLI